MFSAGFPYIFLQRFNRKYFLRFLHGFHWLFCGNFCRVSFRNSFWDSLWNFFEKIYYYWGISEFLREFIEKSLQWFPQKLQQRFFFGNCSCGSNWNISWDLFSDICRISKQIQIFLLGFLRSSSRNWFKITKEFCCGVNKRRKECYKRFNCKYISG